MEKENLIKTITKIIIALIIISIISIIGLNFYKKYLIKENTKNFKKYIKENIKNTDEITYTILKEKHILTKTIKLDKKINSNVSVSYDSDGKITGTLQLYGKNKYGIEGISYLKSTLKNQKFDCEFISNKGYTARCDILKEKSEEFEKEMKTIFKNSNTKAKYIK